MAVGLSSARRVAGKQSLNLRSKLWKIPVAALWFRKAERADEIRSLVADFSVGINQQDRVRLTIQDVFQVLPPGFTQEKVSASDMQGVSNHNGALPIINAGKTTRSLGEEC